MSAQAPGPGRRSIGDITPKLAELTDDVLYADVWERPDLSKRDRSLVTVAALVALYRADELTELITHLAFYTGWPCSVTAAKQLRAILADRPENEAPRP